MSEELKQEKTKTKKKIRKSIVAIWILSIIIILLIAAEGIYYYLDKNNLLPQGDGLMSDFDALTNGGETSGTDKTPPEVELIKVEKGLIAEYLKEMTGTVRSNQTVKLSWQTSGTVATVNVKIGDKVKQGDVLASLETGTIDPAILKAAVTKEDAEEKLERAFTSTLELATAYKAVIDAKAAVKKTEYELESMGIIRGSDHVLGDLYRDFVEAQQSYQSALENYEILRVRPLDDLDRQMAVGMLESARAGLERARSQYGWYSGEVDTLVKQQKEAELLLKQAEYDDAVRAYDKIKDGVPASKIKALEAEVDAANATTKSAKIIAPIDAIVADMNVKPLDKIDTATSKDTVAIRLEDISAHLINVSISEMKVNSLSLGQTVDLVFDAIPLKQYTGKILTISNVGIVENSVVSYPVTIRMDNADGKVRSGMTAKVKVRIKEEPEALIIPMDAIGYNPDGSPYVEKKNEDGTFTIIPIKIGLQTITKVQALSTTLKEGDLLKKAPIPAQTDMTDEKETEIMKTIEGVDSTETPPTEQQKVTP